MNNIGNTTVVSMELKEWRQFERIKIDFHPSLTIITGKNGSGKSTMLYLLSKYFGWNLDFVSLPRKNKYKKLYKFLTGVWNPLDDIDVAQQKNIGNIILKNGKKSDLILPDKSQQAFYTITPTPFYRFKGLHIHSHRPAFTYQPITQIPTAMPTRGQMYHDYNTAIQNRFSRVKHGNRNKTAFHSLKEKLIALATFGEGNSIVMPDETAKQTFNDFQNILRIVLPKKIGFKRIKIHLPEVILETQSGDFAIDAVSGGLASLIHTAWQIFLYSETNASFVVTYDEPENHLHPELQKTILPNLIKAFPNIQFIVATHNPLIISSVKDCSIYVLDYNENNKIVSKLIENYDKAGSSNHILRKVLGLDNSMPQWVENKIETLINNYLETRLDSTKLQKFKKELEKEELDEYLSDSLTKLIDKAKQDDKIN